MKYNEDAPPEWSALQVVDRFGVLAAFGRQPTPREMRRMMFVERCARAWSAREAAKDQEGGWGGWGSKNPDARKLLDWLIKVGEDGE